MTADCRPEQSSAVSPAAHSAVPKSAWPASCPSVPDPSHQHRAACSAPVPASAAVQHPPPAAGDWPGPAEPCGQWRPAEHQPAVISAAAQSPSPPFSVRPVVWPVWPAEPAAAASAASVCDAPDRNPDRQSQFAAALILRDCHGDPRLTVWSAADRPDAACEARGPTATPPSHHAPRSPPPHLSAAAVKSSLPH